MKEFLILCGGLYLLIQAANALTCYNCSTTKTNDCLDLTNVQTVECEPTKRNHFPQVCIRKVLKGNCGINVTMQCTDKQTGNECEPPKNSTYDVKECKVCREDLCNSSNFTSYIGLLSLLSFILGKLYLFNI